MKTGRPARLWLLAALMLLTSGCASMKVVRVMDDTEVAPARLAEWLRPSRLILVGEAHDEMRDHEMQLAVIRLLHAAGRDIAIGMEMFNAEDQAALDRWAAGTMTEAELFAVYNRNWKVPWRNYREILLYARVNGIPVVGMNINREVVHQVFKSGFGSLTPEQRKMLPGARCDVSPAYEAFIRKTVGDHEIKDAAFINFCEAQMVWDVFMAATATTYLDAHPGRAMVALAGSGHVLKYAMPEQVRRLSNIPYAVILPQAHGWFEHDKIGALEADYMLVDRYEFLRIDGE
ncbi:MAG: ChaN family lipoprotein [Deltaproteobacteria bacterium]|nr:ChaN family lipoprotein [Deltaproteobacteria bacterium]